MKGTDVTGEQIEAARQFIVGRGGRLASDEQMVALTAGELVRVVAWYGALRFKAGRDGTGGTLEHPGELEVVGEQPKEGA